MFMLMVCNNYQNNYNHNIFNSNIIKLKMVNIIETVELMTSGLTLDRLMLESYSGKIFESQRQAVRKDREWYFHFKGLQKNKLFQFLNEIDSLLDNEQYIVREKGQNILIRNSQGSLIYLE